MTLLATPAGQSPFAINHKMADLHGVAIFAQQEMPACNDATV
jgi:hypothetical protein